MLPGNALFFNLFMWTKVIMLNLPAEEDKMPISGMTVSMATTARLQGAEGVTFSQQYSSTRNTESEGTILAVSVIDARIQQSFQQWHARRCRTKSKRQQIRAVDASGSNSERSEPTERKEHRHDEVDLEDRSKASTVTSRPAHCTPTGRRRCRETDLDQSEGE